MLARGALDRGPIAARVLQDQRSQFRMRRTLGAVAALAFVLRALPLLRANGAVGTADYDEGVYVGAAALFTRGFVPYRDFGFLHPPGLVLFLSPIVWVAHAVSGYALAFAASRWLVC